MKAYSIDAKKQELKEIDIDMQPNTVYSFFNSILIDEFDSLEHHTIHADAEALSKKKEIYLIGEQLVVGDALIVGKDGILEVDTTIPKEELDALINYEVPKFYLDALALLQTTDINLYKRFEIKKEEELIPLSTEWVLYVFNMADERTREFFLSELKKAVEAKDDILLHIQKMAVLALQAGANS